jgi:4,5-DOPA dioxygenase extradiol
VRFEERARELLETRNHGPLINYEALGPDATLAAPTPDHYLPLLYIAALQREDDEVSFPVEGYDGGSISMLSVRIG